MPRNTRQLRADKKRTKTERNKARICKTFRNSNEPLTKWEKKYETLQTKINKDNMKWKSFGPISGPNFKCWPCARWNIPVFCKTAQDLANHQSGRKHARAMFYDECEHDYNIARQYYEQEEELQQEEDQRRQRQEQEEEEEDRRREEEKAKKQRIIKKKMEKKIQRAREKMEETVEQAHKAFTSIKKDAIIQMEQEIQKATSKPYYPGYKRNYEDDEYNYGSDYNNIDDYDDGCEDYDGQW